MILKMQYMLNTMDLHLGSHIKATINKRLWTDLGLGSLQRIVICFLHLGNLWEVLVKNVDSSLQHEIE